MGKLDSVQDGDPAGAGYGIMVAGVPLGDEAYVNSKLASRVSAICEDTKQLVEILRDRTQQGLYVFVEKC